MNQSTYACMCVCVCAVATSIHVPDGEPARPSKLPLHSGRHLLRRRLVQLSDTLADPFRASCATVHEMRCPVLLLTWRPSEFGRRAHRAKHTIARRSRTTADDGLASPTCCVPKLQLVMRVQLAPVSSDQLAPSSHTVACRAACREPPCTRAPLTFYPGLFAIAGSFRCGGKGGRTHATLG